MNIEFLNVHNNKKKKPMLNPHNWALVTEPWTPQPPQLRPRSQTPKPIIPHKWTLHSSLKPNPLNPHNWTPVPQPQNTFSTTIWL